MKALIAGVGGQVGRALLRTAPAGLQTVGLSRQELDIADAHAVIDCVRQHRPSVIINAAAYTAVDRAESEPDLAQRVNVDGAKHLASAAAEVGARLIHISTDFVFDGLASVPYTPDSPANPLNTYGLTKLHGEQAVLALLPEHSVILRTAWVYAAEGQNFVRTMLRLMATKGTVRVVVDQIGTPTAAHSIARAIWQIVERPTIRGVHHWTDAGVASWYDFAVAVAEEAARLGLLSEEVEVIPIRTDEYPTSARRPSYSVLDKSSLTSLGIMPVHWRVNLRSVLGEIRNA